MSKKKGAWGMTLGEIVETLSVLERRGVTPAHFKALRTQGKLADIVANAIIESASIYGRIADPRRARWNLPPPTQMVYEVNVDYKRPLEDVTAAGKYNEGSSTLLSSKEFPTSRRSVHHISIELRPLQEGECIDETYDAKLAKEGYRHANIYELATLGEQHPQLQLSFWIWALGSVEKNSIKVQETEWRRGLPRPRTNELAPPFKVRRHQAYLEGRLENATSPVEKRSIGINATRDSLHEPGDNAVLALVKI